MWNKSMLTYAITVIQTLTVLVNSVNLYVQSTVHDSCMLHCAIISFTYPTYSNHKL